MGLSLILTILVSVVVSAFFIGLQYKFYRDTNNNRDRYQSFFDHRGNYSTTLFETTEGKEISLISEGNLKSSDLRQLVKEINLYVQKNVGTTDFSVIQNKTERKLNMRYEEAMSRRAFPTYLGLMGTFAGVFVGIIMFIIGFDGTEGVTDDSIRNLLIGVLVSMATSLIGLAMTTNNNYNASNSKKKIDEDKNEFYDFIQNELMPTLDVSMVAALNKLHNTVNMFEPSFNRVINRFQTTFDKCTEAFGERFQKNVEVVSTAVAIMGDNMDKVNDNVEHQNQLLNTLKSRGMMRTLEQFVEAIDKFEQITKSLNDFERARRMMLDATNKVVEYQRLYNDSLQIPMAVASKVNDILNRITRFENSINTLGTNIAQTQMIGNDTIELIRAQINAIKKKGKLAAKYIDTADERLETLFGEQVKMIDEMNGKYKAALDSHINQYAEQIEFFAKEIQERRQNFLDAIGQRINIEDVREDFSNLKKLDDIDKRLKELEARIGSSKDLQDRLDKINSLLNEVKGVVSKISTDKDKKGDSGKPEEKGRGGWFFGRGGN